MSVSPKIFKQVRKALGLTQQELADALGLSRVTVNKMEQGRLKRGIPDEIAARLMKLKTSPVVEDAARGRDPWRNLAGYNGPGAQSARANDNHLWDNEEDES